MGIEIRCPNGHQSRVKDRFAGKKVYCPECGATVRVPHGAGQAVVPTAALVSLDATYAAGLPRAVAVAKPAPRSLPSNKESGARQGRSPRADAGKPSPGSGRVVGSAKAGSHERNTKESGGAREHSGAGPAAEPARPLEKPGLHPVIAEAVEMPWNVALPGGDPSEPLEAETLQEWLNSGGATGEELVWRADWPDWVPIRLVFPEHLPGAKP